MADHTVVTPSHWQVFPRDVWRIIVTFLREYDIITAAQLFGALRGLITEMIKNGDRLMFGYHSICAKNKHIYFGDSERLNIIVDHARYAYMCGICQTKIKVIDYAELERREIMDNPPLRHCGQFMHIMSESRQYDDIATRWIFHSEDTFREKDDTGMTTSDKFIRDAVANGIPNISAVQRDVNYAGLCKLANSAEQNKIYRQAVIGRPPNKTRDAKLIADIRARYEFVVKLHEQCKTIIARYACYLWWSARQEWCIDVTVPEWAKNESPYLLRTVLEAAAEMGTNPFPLGEDTPMPEAEWERPLPPWPEKGTMYSPLRVIYNKLTNPQQFNIDDFATVYIDAFSGHPDDMTSADAARIDDDDEHICDDTRIDADVHIGDDDDDDDLNDPWDSDSDDEDTMRRLIDSMARADQTAAGDAYRANNS